MSYPVSKTHYADQSKENFVAYNTMEEFMVNIMKSDFMSNDEFVDECVANTELAGAAEFAATWKELLSRDPVSVDFNVEEQSVTIVREWETAENFAKHREYYNNALPNSEKLQALVEALAYNNTVTP